MSEAQALIDTFKRCARARGRTYKDLARALGVSEPTIKRLLTKGGLTLERLAELCQAIDMSLAELWEEASALPAPIHRLTAQQERELANDPKLLLVTVLAMNHWTVEQMTATYDISEAECIRKLVLLERLGMIALLAGNRIRPRVARDFDWLPNGPIRNHFRARYQPDFLDDAFDRSDDTLVFFHGMLAPSEAAQFRRSIDRLRLEFAELHRESLSLPLTRRRGMGVLLALREWEPESFRELRRDRIQRDRLRA